MLDMNKRERRSTEEEVSEERVRFSRSVKRREKGSNQREESTEVVELDAAIGEWKRSKETRALPLM